MDDSYRNTKCSTHFYVKAKVVSSHRKSRKRRERKEKRKDTVIRDNANDDSDALLIYIWKQVIRNDKKKRMEKRERKNAEKTKNNDR